MYGAAGVGAGAGAGAWLPGTDVSTSNSGSLPDILPSCAIMRRRPGCKQPGGKAAGGVCACAIFLTHPKDQQVVQVQDFRFRRVRDLTS